MSVYVLGAEGPDFNSYLYTDTIPKTSFPQSWSIWFKADSDATFNHFLMTIGNLSEYDYYLYLLAQQDPASDAVKMGRIEGGSHYSTADWFSWSTGTWHHMGCSFGSSGEQLLYFNGTQIDDSITAAYGTNYNRFAIGARLAVYTPKSAKARLAHAAVWGSVLSSTDMSNLYNGGVGGGGKNPQAVSSANLISHWPLVDNANDAWGSNDLTETADDVTWYASDNPTVDSLGGNMAYILRPSGGMLDLNGNFRG